MSKLRLAIQRNGRLSDDTFALLRRAGLEFDSPKGRLIVNCDGLPVDLLLVRDDDIPNCVRSGACDAGIVGPDVVEEDRLQCRGPSHVQRLEALKFGRCRLALAVPEGKAGLFPVDFRATTIATSFPGILRDFLAAQGMERDVTIMSGSVELAPRLGIADAVCDLVSSGATLRANGLKEVATVFESEAVLIGRTELGDVAVTILARLLARIRSVLRARSARYVMMNARRDQLDAICRIAPGVKEPTIIPLASDPDQVAVHVLSSEGGFWETVEQLRAVGATDILVLPVEKYLE